MDKIYVVALFIALFIVACTKDRMPTLVELDNQLRNLVTASSPEGEMEFYILPDENDLDNIPQDPKNPLTPAKVELGKMLFHDTGLAMDAMQPSGLGTYSCASCHIAEAGFKPNNFQGIADGGIGFGNNGENRLMNSQYQEHELDVQSARPLSLVNVAYVKNTFWNGQFGSTGVNVGTEEVWDLLEETELNHLGFEGIETQNIEGLKVHRITINKELLDEYGYTPLFDEVFSDIPVEERYTIMTASFAFSAYIRSIISNKAPFQDWLKGDEEALSYDEKKGAILFFGKAKCSTCHYNQNLGSPEFHALGVDNMYQLPSYNSAADDRRNMGRGGFTLREEDMHKFKVPGVYNAGDAEFFFHGASATSLEELVEYFNNGVPENPNVPIEQISAKFNPLNLDDTEKAQLVAFLRNGLHDPELERYKPEFVLSGKCFPNADQQSMFDLDCQ